MIELKAVVRDKPQGRRRIRYVARIEGTHEFITKELNPKVKFNRKSVLDSVAYDFNVDESEIEISDEMLKERKLNTKAIFKKNSQVSVIRSRDARDQR
jgi:hypothetical protein